MRNFVLLSILVTGAASAQGFPDANSIVVTATKTVVLVPTDVTFMLNLSADISTPMDQVLAAVDFGLTTADIVSINSYPVPPIYTAPTPNRVTYVFRLSVPASKMKDTIDKLEKLRKNTDTGIDLSYSTTAIGPSQAAVDDAHEKALPDLMAAARKQAQALATAAQLKLGAIQGVSEGYSYPSGYPAVVYQPVITFSAVVRFAAQ
jgi:hypothetical protein